METEFLHGHLVLDTKDNIKLINVMDKELLGIQMDRFIQENGRMIYALAKENLLKQVKIKLSITKVILKMTFIMVKELLSGSYRQRPLKTQNTKVNGAQENNRAQESLLMMTEAFMKVAGRIIKEMEQAKCNGRQRKVFLCMKENGKMI